MSLLNLISIWASEAAYRYESIGSGLAESARKKSDNIYRFLSKNGLYQ